MDAAAHAMHAIVRAEAATPIQPVTFVPFRIITTPATPHAIQQHPQTSST